MSKKDRQDDTTRQQPGNAGRPGGQNQGQPSNQSPNAQYKQANPGKGGQGVLFEEELKAITGGNSQIRLSDQQKQQAKSIIERFQAQAKANPGNFETLKTQCTRELQNAGLGALIRR
jgi:hypothetical protein